MPIWELNELMTNELIMNLSFAQLTFQIDAFDLHSDWFKFWVRDVKIEIEI